MNNNKRPSVVFCDQIKIATREGLADELAAAGEYTGDWETADMDDLQVRVRLIAKVRVKARAKVFGSLKIHNFIVDIFDSVHVFDSVAGYYTICHSMTQKAQDRIRSLAVKQRKAD